MCVCKDCSTVIRFDEHEVLGNRISRVCQKYQLFVAFTLCLELVNGQESLAPLQEGEPRHLTSARSKSLQGAKPSLLA